jgi:hypothetical protein
VPVLLAGVLTVSVLHTDIATPTAAAAALGFTQRLYLGCSSSHNFVSVSLGLAFFLPVVCGGGRVLAWCQCAGRCRDGVLAAVAAAVLACHAVPSVHPLYIWGLTCGFVVPLLDPIQLAATGVLHIFLVGCHPCWFLLLWVCRVSD